MRGRFLPSRGTRTGREFSRRVRLSQETHRREPIPPARPPIRRSPGEPAPTVSAPAVSSPTVLSPALSSPGHGKGSSGGNGFSIGPGSITGSCSRSYLILATFAIRRVAEPSVEDIWREDPSVCSDNCAVRGREKYRRHAWSPPYATGPERPMPTSTQAARRPVSLLFLISRYD